MSFRDGGMPRTTQGLEDVSSRKKESLSYAATLSDSALIRPMAVSWLVADFARIVVAAISETSVMCPRTERSRPLDV